MRVHQSETQSIRQCSQCGELSYVMDVFDMRLAMEVTYKPSCWKNFYKIYSKVDESDVGSRWVRWYVKEDMTNRVTAIETKFLYAPHWVGRWCKPAVCRSSDCMKRRHWLRWVTSRVYGRMQMPPCLVYHAMMHIGVHTNSGTAKIRDTMRIEWVAIVDFARA